MGRYYAERLQFGVLSFREQREVVSDVVNKKFVVFETLTNVKWPEEIKDLKTIEQATLLFRLANTQFKKALDFFVLDGYVTEHVQLK